MARVRYLNYIHLTHSNKISRRDKYWAQQLLKAPWGPSGWPRGLKERPYCTRSTKISRRDKKSSPQLLKTPRGPLGLSMFTERPQKLRNALGIRFFTRNRRFPDLQCWCRPYDGHGPHGWHGAMGHNGVAGWGIEHPCETSGLLILSI